MNFSNPAARLCLLIAAVLLASACSRSREAEKVVRETVVAPQTVVVRETVLVERIVVVTPTPDLSREPVTLQLNLGGEPLSIDPALASDAAGLDVVESLFLGLTAFDPQGNVEPRLATAWTVSDDGLRWTFTLRDDVFWVSYRPSSGVTPIGPLTADDVAYAVRRACDPRTGASQAVLNYVIAGCQALHTADPASSAQQLDALAQAVGVEALDATTVEFTLSEPAGYFPAVAGLPLNRPLHQATVEQHGPAWTEPGNVVSNGPFMLAGWFHGDSMALERNPLWPGWQQAAGNVERIELAMLADDQAALARYQTGELDSVVVPPAGLAQVQADATLSQELTISATACSEYLGFDNSQPPLDDALVRRALSAAIDRAALVQSVTRGGELPANTHAPAMVFGSATGDPTIAPWTLPEAQGGWGYAKALAQAQAWLAEAGYPDGVGLPPLTFVHNAADGPAQMAQAVAAMWRDGLGVEVAVESLPWPEYWRLVGGGLGGSAQTGPSDGTSAERLPHVWRMGFCGDLPDQQGWLHQQFNTDQGADRLRWADDANAPLAADGRSFNQLTEAAQRSADPAERQALYREAERILSDGAAAYAPLYYYGVETLTKPYLQRSFFNLTGNRFETWVLDWPAKRAVTGP
ncbi:MAG: peptide ABC transporter substrate-binding protein [Anaerolineae bacterium]